MVYSASLGINEKTLLEVSIGVRLSAFSITSMMNFDSRRYSIGTGFFRFSFAFWSETCFTTTATEFHTPECNFSTRFVEIVTFNRFATDKIFFFPRFLHLEFLFSLYRAMRSHIPYCMYISMDQNKGGLVTYFFPLSFSILFMFERIIATRQTGVSEI